MSAADTEIRCAEFERIFSLMLDVPAIYAEWRGLVTQHAVMGKKAHDARIVAAMKVHNVSHLLTFNGMTSNAFKESLLQSRKTSYNRDSIRIVN